VTDLELWHHVHDIAVTAGIDRDIAVEMADAALQAFHKHEAADLRRFPF
jgi:hypothetical protein